MLLLLNNESALSTTEQRFAEWIRWSPDQPGVVLMNVQIPDRAHRTRQLDALIWTPQRCITLELKGFRTRQDGVLRVPPNGPWRMADGRPAALYGNDDDHNPMDQVHANTMATKNWLEQTTGVRCAVHGLILVLLLPGQDVPGLDAPQRPPMTDIIVEDFDVFRYYLDRVSDQPIDWTSDRIAPLIDTLGLRHLYGPHTDLATAMGEPAPPPAVVER
ncbi:nuclease-related domain-containing protein [Nocardia sp. alder85J]|uniref:nuclease-related domain-containing protein n=1 Tax=Nocardia sp. alder85J TaxID=2862949 RepID=UPI001CD43C06|nr:nuclease-related domain-containing protein [Nocardia sp. alder85J]MCX4092323.1 nuclease-related domain-containing protein [Nocardia sp. alder85J]